MKVLVFGADGMLGSDLVKVLEKDHQIIKSLEKDLDITNKKEVSDLISSVEPNWVINAAAYTDVDGCETNEVKAFAVNADGPKNIAEVCSKVGSKLIHFSTDYVFDGTKKEPYTEGDIPNPINVYGASKLAGEKNIQSSMEHYIIIRTQWLFGKKGKNFVDTICNLLKEGNELKIVNDQVGSPTHTVDLAHAVNKLIEAKVPFGIYNVCNSGYCSWYDYACEIAKLKSKDKVKILPISTEEMPRAASRPKNSKLEQSKFNSRIDCPVKHWRDSLRSYLGLG